MKRIKIKKVDAFTSEPFAGNPAGVVTDADGLGEEEMQKIAREINISETAFVFEPDNSLADFKLRFFTPSEEVPLCGHATVAAFHALAEEGRINRDSRIAALKQQTGAGILQVEIRFADNKPEKIIMAQNLPKFFNPRLSRSAIAKILNIKEKQLGSLPLEIVSTGLPFLIVPIHKLSTIENMIPDFETMKNFCSKRKIAGFYVFTFETVKKVSALHARCFAPAAGINEDPVTGTASGAVASYLIKHEAIDIKPTVEITCEQGHEMSRPGEVFVTIETSDEKISSVKVGGRAVTVLNGEVLIP